MTTKILPNLAFHDVCAIEVSTTRKYERAENPFWAADIMLIDENGERLIITVFGARAFPINITMED